MRRIIFVLAASFAACGDNTPPAEVPEPTPDAAPDATGPRAACVDRTSDLPRPPRAGEPLACDMLPPGAVLP